MTAPPAAQQPPPGVLSPAEELVTVFARMSGVLLSQETVTTALELVTHLAVEAVEAADAAGITLVDAQGRRTTNAATDPLTERADATQYELDQGPCLAAWAGRTGVRVDDVRTDARWPRWASAADDLGLRSALSSPLVAGDAALGAVKLYARTPNAFDARSERLLGMFAAQAAILVANVQSAEAGRRVSEDLRGALRDRDAIACARGVLMAREGVDQAGAFALLAARAQREGRTVHATARALVDATARRHR